MLIVSSESVLIVVNNELKILPYCNNCMSTKGELQIVVFGLLTSNFLSKTISCWEINFTTLFDDGTNDRDDDDRSNFYGISTSD